MIAEAFKVQMEDPGLKKSPVVNYWSLRDATLGVGS